MGLLLLDNKRRLAAQAAVNGIPFWGTPGTAENWTKPDYSGALAASWGFDGDPSASLAVDWRDIANTANPGPAQGIAGTDGVWKVTARSGYTGIAVGAEYNTLNNIWPDMLAEASGTLILPAVEVKDRLEVNPSVVPAGGTHLIVRGAVSSGAPATHLGPTANSTIFVQLSTTNDLGIWLDVRNVRVGPFNSDITANGGETGSHRFGSYGFRFTFEYGRLTVRNCRIHRTNDNGIESPQSATREWLKRLNAVIDVYDTEFSYCGLEGTEHNVYTHALKRLMMIRCYSHSAATHAVKSDNDLTVLLNNVISSEPVYGGTTGTNRIINIEGLNEVYAYQNVIEQQLNNIARFAVDLVSRRNTSNTINGKRTSLAYYKRQLTQWDARKVEWKFGGLREPQHSAGVVTNGPYSAGATSIDFFRVGGIISNPDSSNFRDLNNTGSNAYDVKIILGDGTVLTTTGTRTASANSTLTLTLATSLPSALSNLQPAVFKLTTDNWDLPLLNEACHNPAHPDYPWDTLDDGTGHADPSDANAVLQILERNVFWPVSSDVTNAGWVMNSGQKQLYAYWTSANDSHALPQPPLKATNGEWADPAGAGEWEQDINGAWPLVGLNASGGTGTQGSAYVDPTVSILTDTMEYDEHLTEVNRHVNQVFNNAVTANDPWQPALSPDTRYVDAAGAVQKVAVDDRSSPALAPVQATVSGAHSANATTITLDDATGFAADMKVSIRMTGGPWGKEWHFATITGVSGADITIDVGLPFASATGSAVSAVTASGTKPSWWPDVVELGVA